MTDEELAARLEQLKTIASGEKNDRIYEREAETIRVQKLFSDHYQENKHKFDLDSIAQQATNDEIQLSIDRFDELQSETIRVMQQKDPVAADKALQFLANLEAQKEQTTKAFWDKQNVGDPLKGLKEFFAENDVTF